MKERITRISTQDVGKELALLSPDNNNGGSTMVTPSLRWRHFQAQKQAVISLRFGHLRDAALAQREANAIAVEIAKEKAEQFDKNLHASITSFYDSPVVNEPQAQAEVEHIILPKK